VTNLANQKSCIVEITDRGPFSHGRIIDVSHAAAEKLGMMDAGVANVQLEILGTMSSGTSQDIASGFYQPASDRVAPTAQKHPAFTLFDIGSDVSAYSGEDAGH
jgi:rare lipoprotein A